MNHTLNAKYLCYACKAPTPKVGEAEIREGWGKMQARVGFGRRLRTITLVHCPKHRDGFPDAVAAAARNVSAKAGRR